MARTKSVQIKRIPHKKDAVIENKDEGLAEPISIKNKKGLELDEPEHALGEEEKNEEDAASEEEDELAADEITLDDEELNPFGDKWEE